MMTGKRSGDMLDVLKKNLSSDIKYEIYRRSLIGVCLRLRLCVVSVFVSVSVSVSVFIVE